MEQVDRNFSLGCDVMGRVTKILNDPDNLVCSVEPGNMFFNIVVPGDLNKILNFFMEIKSKGTAIGWDINISTPSGPLTFHFFGGLFGDDIEIAASDSWDSAEHLFAELTRFNYEQGNIIRQISKEKAKLQADSPESSLSFYNEFSQMNNELVNMQRELAKKNQELDRLNKLKNQFLGIVAHDLRNPLGIIIGYSKLMLDPAAGVTDEEKSDIAYRIHKSGKFMLGLVNDLLDIANIESGILELDLSEQNLVEVIRANIEMSNLLTPSKSINIRFTDPPGPIMTLIDRPKIDQAMTNFITNALKYSFPGTEVEVLLESNPSYHTIAVRDQGPGIRETELADLFKPFQKASSKSTGGETSTGLGLFIVKKIIEAHGGEVGVLSTYGKGSEFFFTLPV